MLIIHTNLVKHIPSKSVGGVGKFDFKYVYVHTDVSYGIRETRRMPAPDGQCARFLRQAR